MAAPERDRLTLEVAVGFGVKEYGDRLGLKNTRWICLNVHRDDS